ncbi:MAG: sugar phosphate isomerase/epimerase [Alphaproteobacteria bacterium]|nr:sugar phosphate isomerase/epimerase [Alphaproteobacteria bacterium]
MSDTQILGVGLSIPCEHPNYADLGTHIDAAYAAGVTYVEIPLHKLDLMSGARIFRPRLAEVAGLVAGRANTLHGHLGINLMEDPHLLPLHLDVLKANIEVAQALGSIHLVIHSGFARPQQGAALERAYERQREALAAIAPMAEAAGVVVCVENIFTYDHSRHTALPARLAAELALIDQPAIRATFDFSHGYINCGLHGVDFVEQAKALAPFSKHLHVHDSFGRPKDFWTYSLTEDLAFGAGDLHLPLGWGDLPFARIAAEACFPAGLVADIELQARFWSELPETIALTRAFAASLRPVA